MGTDGEGNPVTHYTATASYTGTASSRYATGYTVTANYTGEVSKAGCNMVTYTAVFGSEKIAGGSAVSGSDKKDGTDPVDNTDASNAAGDSDTVKEPVDLSGIKRPLIIGCVVLILAGAGVLVFKKFKQRRG